ncbi:(2Fe-2S)-binding protein [Kitasatospora cathayae]|uniref:(2Fe-2S)-binding protein n=1 Tax=Kitasatospora cathayae TaxID=3004092 RepID=A0ABY7PZY7_9ACTN|nr:(2Fe-2S)-binding protein [Kitasatospora sp. HUAS 3-15]WBP85934.1 (2Fe-2S)-binding protein [Kitasatospora sp. HUAS 3-15]
MVPGTPLPVLSRGRSVALAGDYHRLCGLCPVLRLRLLDPTEDDPSAADGWYSGTQLATDERVLAAALAGEEARIAAEHGRAPRPHVTASRLLHHYVWSACLLIAGPWHLARRVPVVDPADLWLHAPTGALALRPGGHVTRPGDDELRAELRSAVVTHLEPVLAAFAGPTRRRDRALWGMVTDDLASAVWYLGRMLDAQDGHGVQDGHGGHGVQDAQDAQDAQDRQDGQGGQGAKDMASVGEDAAVAAASALLPGGTLPLPGAADFRRLRTPDGRDHHTRTRLGCCLYYAVKPEAVACLTCPRTGDEERLRRF